ncbi:hypothetical protein AFLA70_262g001441 [Aspergillus flavus AF70]|nr:hypothetical protein AFLA70_262g001441 [Aspergillus flavus AF70]
MDHSLPGGRRPRRRSGPRSRKGTLTCRGRHTRCDEARPICGNCRKSRLQCQQPEFVPSKWNICNPAVAGTGRRTEIPPEPNLDGQCTTGNSVREPEPQRYGEHQVQEPQSTSSAGADREVVSPPAESVITPEIVHLLRVYEKSIATWMDVFDSELTYQRRLVCMAPSSPLILNAICALAARQLSLVGSSHTWKPVSEHYYGQAVHLMARLLDVYPSEMELAIVGTILLSSYELLAFPGLDYQRHLKGAHTIVASLHAHNSASCLTRASFWIYARHEVAEALNRNSPTLHDPGSWPKFDLSRAEPAEDSFCNDVVRLTAETVCIVFGKTSRSRTKRRKRDLSTLQGELRNWLHICPEQWKGTEYTEDGNVRYWFPRPKFGTVLALHISKPQPDSRGLERRCDSDLPSIHAASVA